jgi:hypothetical protein
LRKVLLFQEERNVREQCDTWSWRRGRDSNPRYGCPYAAFRVRCFQPLSHLSDVPENDAFPRGVRSCNEAGAVKQGQAGPGVGRGDRRETDAKPMRFLAAVRRVIGGRKRRMGMPAVAAPQPATLVAYPDRAYLRATRAAQRGSSCACDQTREHPVSEHPMSEDQ